MTATQRLLTGRSSQFADTGGGGGAVQTAEFSFSHTSGAQSTGPLGFTPLFAIYVAATKVSGGNNPAAVSMGFATGVGALAKSAGFSGANNNSNITGISATADADSIAGGTGASFGQADVATAYNFADLDVTQFDAGGIELTWSAAVTSHEGHLLVIGMTSGPGTDEDALWIKNFFEEQALLPLTTILDALYTVPTPDFQNLNSGTLNVSMSRLKFTPSGTPANFGYDMGGEKTTNVLVVLGAMRPRGVNNDGIFITDTLPAANEIPDGSYIFFAEVNSVRFSLAKKSGGSITVLASIASPFPAGAASDASIGMALYWEAATNRLVALVRMGSECWFPILDITDASFAQFRYAGIRAENAGGGGAITYYVSPLVIRAD